MAFIPFLKKPAGGNGGQEEKIAALEQRLRNVRAANRRLSISVEAWKIVGEELVENKILTREGLRSYLSQARRFVADKKGNS